MQLVKQPVASDQPQITPLGGRLGALIENVRLSGALAPDVVESIRRAVLRHKVVFLRNQSQTDLDIENLAELLGDPVALSLHGAVDYLKERYDEYVAPCYGGRPSRSVCRAI